MPKFWQWYDRASRVDFASTLLGLVFDWKTWLVSLFSGGAVTFIWAAIDGRSPLDVWLMALLASACILVVIAGGVALLQMWRNPSEPSPSEARSINAVVDAPPQQPDFLEMLRRSTVVQLREIVTEFGQELRAFQRDLNNRRNAVLMQQMEELRPVQDKEQRARIWSRQTQDIMRLSEQDKAEFQARFRSKGIALQEEMSRRQGVNRVPSIVDSRVSPLEFGTLSGSDPLVGVADVLDELARKLR